VTTKIGHLGFQWIRNWTFLGCFSHNSVEARH